ncbi:MAG: V-type ATP synthase subunit D [Myxococcota bacterium]|nr:V-type ATP synthase subunit D [Myxococcota bacterium]
MPRLPVPVSKSTLLRLRADLGFLRAGRDILDQKREFLSEALVTFAREARAARARVEEALAEAWEAYAEAQAALGEAGLDRLALAADPVPPIAVRERSLMGVVVPVVEAGDGVSEGSLCGAIGEVGSAAAPAAARLRALLPRLLELAELEASCRRVAREVVRTRRKLNALEQVHLPAHQETLRFVEDQLEERERESLFQLKRVTSLREDSP